MWAPPQTLISVQDLIASVETTVAGLHKEKRRLATVIHRHLVSAWYDRDVVPTNLLVLGPSGGGKSFMVRKMLEASGLPFAEINATQYSEVGYRGNDIAWLFYAFLSKYADETLKPKALIPLVERWGVVVLDEIDKWRYQTNLKERQPQRQLQAELLKILEGDLITARQNDTGQGFTFWTPRIMFIGCGAFEGLDNQMRRSRTELDIEMPNIYTQAQPRDIQDYGFMQELVGRFPSILALPPLNAHSMAQILIHTIWPRYQQEAEDVGIELIADGTAMLEIANVTIGKKIGARGFATVIDEMLRDVWSLAEPGDSIVVDVDAVHFRRAKLLKAATV